MTIWFHPQRGAVVSEKPLNRQWLRYRGGPDDGWRQIPEPLPRGFLRGDPAKQQYGMGGPILVYGPLERRCRDCKTHFAFPASEQKHWHEVLGFTVDATAVRCLGCRRRMQLQRVYSDAMADAAREPSAKTHLAVARAALAWKKSGGNAPRAKAVMHCRKAQALGSKQAEGVMQTIIAAWR